MKCFYHSADLDGHCSGAIVGLAHPDCELIGFNYGSDFPIESIDPTETVVMVDVSLPLDQMVDLAVRQACHGGAFIWIDHHVGIIREFDALKPDVIELFGGVRDTSKAACELAWEFFHSGRAVPTAVVMLGVYDSWRFEAAEEDAVNSFQYGMRLERETRPEVNFDFWEWLFAHDIESDAFQLILSRGQAVWDYLLSDDARSCRAGAFFTTLMGGDPAGGLAPLRCVGINSQRGTSDVLRSVYDADRDDAMLVFYWSSNGFWRVSIYSTNPDVDCSVYAKSYGGGGHKGAAGFQCNHLPFVLGKGIDLPRRHGVI